ncbi:MAG: hypothetical protein ACTSWQ_09210, partial [Candidatus Thorarchaeota archaeon]
MKSIKYLNRKNEIFSIDDIDNYCPMDRTRIQLEEDWVTVAKWYEAYKKNKELDVSIEDIENLSFMVITELLRREIPLDINKMKSYSKELFARIVEKLKSGRFDEFISHLYYEDYALWTTKYKNELPDSAFMWVDEGGEKDKTGRTVPRCLRHLPFKDINGKVDIVHVRNALARLNQVRGRDGKRMSNKLQADIKNKLEKILITLKDTKSKD